MLCSYYVIRLGFSGNFLKKLKESKKNSSNIKKTQAKRQKTSKSANTDITWLQVLFIGKVFLVENAVFT